MVVLHLRHDKARLDRVRKLGIRSACDLRDAWGDGQHEERRDAITAAFGSGGAGAVETVLASMQGNANLWHIAQFRRHTWLLADGKRSSDGDDIGLAA